MSSNFFEKRLAILNRGVEKGSFFAEKFLIWETPKEVSDELIENILSSAGFVGKRWGNRTKIDELTGREGFECRTTFLNPPAAKDAKDFLLTVIGEERIKKLVREGVERFFVVENELFTSPRRVSQNHKFGMPSIFSRTFFESSRR